MALQPRLDLRPYFQTLDDIDGPLNWESLFANDNPVEVEVGAGRGLFLVNAGLSNPETNYLGIELSYKEGRRAARRIHKRQMPNVRVLGGDAKLIVGERIPVNSVSAVHVYFPDPWWKRRHKKRRVFDDVLLQGIRRILIVGGNLHVWTDVEEYFQVMTDLVRETSWFGPQITPAERAAEHDLDYHTSFERKKRKLGLPIYRAMWSMLEK